MDPEDEGTSYALAHHRAGSTMYFGPFDTIEELAEWSTEHPEVRGVVLRLYRTVDWNR